MARRKIASVTPLWNQEMWIKPHFEMLSSLDKNLVLLHSKPLPSYRHEHGYSIIPDLSEKLLRENFPKVEIVEAVYPADNDFGAGLYNEGLKMLEDYDIVFRLDPDMFWNKENWQKMLDYIQETDFDAYRMDFSNDSINYYMTGDFDHGLRDAREYDVLAVNPKMPFKYIKTGMGLHPLAWDYKTDAFFRWDGFMCHHFRGWNKPKSCPNPQWLEKESTKEAFKQYSNRGEWYKCPDEIKQPLQLWLKDLDQMKQI